MDLSALKAFKIVAREKNISRAAKELNFVQSNVTNKIKQLEMHFNTQLFYRHRQGVTLTPKGKLLLSYTEKILNLYQEAEKNISYSEVPSGALSVGSMETTAAIRLPSLLTVYHEKYPQVELILKTGPTEELIKSVLNYELEGAFVAGPVNHPNIVETSYIEEELVLIVKKGKEMESSLIEKSGGNKNILVFRKGCSYRKKLEDWLNSEGLSAKRIMEFGSVEGIIGCVKAGLGISLMPKAVVEKMAVKDQLQCIEIPEEFGKVTTFFITRKDVATTSALEKLKLSFNC